MLSFVKCFSVPIEGILWFLSFFFINAVYQVDLFADVEPPIQHWNISYLLMMKNVFCKSLSIYIFEREREIRRGAQAGVQAHSMLSMEPKEGLPYNPEIMTRVKINSWPLNRLSHSGTPVL